MSGNTLPPSTPMVEYASVMPEVSALRAFYDPGALDAAHFRTQLRMRQGEYDISVNSQHIAHYQECVDDYTDVDRRYQQARIGLLKDVLGIVIDDSATAPHAGVHIQTTWRTGQQQLSSGKAVPVAYEVQALTDFDHPTPLTIRTHPMHWLPAGVRIKNTQMRFFLGILEGFVIFASDAHTTELKREDVHLRRLKDLRTDVTQELTDEAFRETLQPWAQQFEKLGDGVEMPPHDVAEHAPWDLAPKDSQLPPLFGLLRNTWDHQIIARLLLEKPASKEEATTILANAFSPATFSALNIVLNQSVETLNQRIQELGIQRRFSWLTENLIPICDQLQDAVLKKVTFGFRDAFVTALQQEEAKTTLLNNLAKSFATETTRVEDNSAPKI